MEFAVNKFLKLKLHNGETSIYVNDTEFMICKAIVFNLKYDSINSIDKSLEESLESMDQYKINNHEISPKQLFWGHCSNLQVWVENNYDCQFLDSSIAFPLLKRLTEVGDFKAKRRFREEIAKKFETDYIPTMILLIRRNFLKYLSKEEISIVLDMIKNRNNLIFEFLIPYLIIEDILDWSKEEIETRMKKFEIYLEEGKFKKLKLNDGILSEIPFLKSEIKKKLG